MIIGFVICFIIVFVVDLACRFLFGVGLYDMTLAFQNIEIPREMPSLSLLIQQNWQFLVIYLIGAFVFRKIMESVY